MGIWRWGWLTITIVTREKNWPASPLYTYREYNIRLMPWPTRLGDRMEVE